MLSVTILLIILTNFIYQTINIDQCDLLSAIDLQIAAYSHSLILRVQPTDSFNKMKEPRFTQVLVREIIKMPTTRYHQIKMNSLIQIRIDNNLDDSCWYLLRITTINIILFSNETNARELILRYPPIESTLNIRQNIDAVIKYGK